MIQRIQTIYLLIAAILLTFLFVNPLAEIIISDGLYLIFWHSRIESLDKTDFHTINTWPVTFLLISTLLIGTVNIFLFKKRILQMRLCVFNIILLFGLVGMIYFFTKSTLNQMNGEGNVFLWPIMLPFISIILTYLAFKGMQKDEKLVRSYDRIR
jgi:hypothetical protein